MKATIQYINKELNGYYPEMEIQSLIRIIIEHVCQISYTDFILRKNDKLDAPVKKEVEKIVSRLKQLEPIQYIIGETEFCGMMLKVTPAVLIPRPETEELVQWITELNDICKFSVIDIGTGSGCIAMALKKYLNEAKVSAVDISDEALEIAQINASRHNLKIEYREADILNFEKYNWEQYDIIVSNPPYVRELEKKQMNNNVLRYEPEDALFVSDNDPLVYYSKIAEFSKKYLKSKRFLFFEINEEFGEQLIILLQKFGFSDIELKKDINGKDRFLKCTKQ